MKVRTQPRSDEFIKSWVADYAKRRRTRRESISYLVSEIRHSGGASFPTNHSQAMDEFERLGFALEHDRNEYGSLLRTYVVLSH
jgi:hypothetical protein